MLVGVGAGVLGYFFGKISHRCEFSHGRWLLGLGFVWEITLTEQNAKHLRIIEREG